MSLSQAEVINLYSNTVFLYNRKKRDELFIHFQNVKGEKILFKEKQKRVKAETFRLDYRKIL